MAEWDIANAKVYFVLGGPGSGKGTQCAKLVEAKGFTHLSAGDLLREERASGSEHGDLIENYIREGKIVPMEITIALLKKAMLATKNEKGYLVDGFPRALDQCAGFESSVCKARFCLFFQCTEDELERRLLIRGQTSGRVDDNIESIKKRFKTYVDQTMPVIEFFRSEGRVRDIDATRSVDDVFATVCTCFDADA
eukprot:a174504_630.p1 GENE.a174504_630~~a174504_630.p1  ORF type:complete len:209 (-),score=99.93 a174504_630:22-606(-)